MLDEKNRVALVSVFAAAALTGGKLAVGLATGSLGILSEAAHSALDFVAAAVTAVAVRLSGRPADDDHNYGHGKVENFSALLETLLLLATCVWIGTEAVKRIQAHNYHVEATLWSFAVIVTSIVVDINRSAMLYRAARKYKSQALEADALHFSSDIFSSAVVLVGLVFVKLGFPIGDPIAALGVAVLVTVACVRLGKRTIDALLDSAPPGLRQRLECQIDGIPGVLRCEKVRVRQSGADTFVDVRVAVAGSELMAQVGAISDRVTAAVRATLPEADVSVTPVALESAAI